MRAEVEHENLNSISLQWVSLSLSSCDILSEFNAAFFLCKHVQFNVENCALFMRINSTMSNTNIDRFRNGISFVFSFTCAFSASIIQFSAADRFNRDFITDSSPWKEIHFPRLTSPQAFSFRSNFKSKTDANKSTAIRYGAMKKKPEQYPCDFIRLDHLKLYVVCVPHHRFVAWEMLISVFVLNQHCHTHRSMLANLPLTQIISNDFVCRLSPAISRPKIGSVHQRREQFSSLDVFVGLTKIYIVAAIVCFLLS